MEKKKSIKKTVIISIISIIALIIGILIVLIFKEVALELKEEDILKQEIINYSNMDLATDDYSIKIKTTGDRAYVEEAVKRYYKKLSDNIKAINYYLNNGKIQNILSYKSLLVDRPNYIKSHNTIKNTKNKINKYFGEISELCDEKTIKNLIDKQKLSDPDYYYDLYLQLVYTDKDLKSLEETKEYAKETAESLNKFLDKIDEIISFIEKNDQYVEYKNNNIYFNSENVLNEFKKLIDELDGMTNDIMIDDYTTVENSKEETSI